MPDEALLHELVQRVERRLDRRRRVGLVHLVDVDHVGAQPPQRAFDGPADVVARAARVVGALVHLLAELRREHDPVAAPFERAADEVLAHPLPVDVGGVEERDPVLERRVDHRNGRVVVDPHPEVVRPEPDDRHLGPPWPSSRVRMRATLPAEARAMPQ